MQRTLTCFGIMEKSLQKREVTFPGDALVVVRVFIYGLNEVLLNTSNVRHNI